MITRKLTFHADPAHGWLEVSLEDIKLLGIEKMISDYSYTQGDRAYLEEDVDAGIYIETARASGWTIYINEKYSDRDSFIRSLPRFEVAHA